MPNNTLQLTWPNKELALIPSVAGRYGYQWVHPSDPRYCETHTLTVTDRVDGEQVPKEDGRAYSDRADLKPTTDNLLVLGESGDVLEALTRVPELAEKYLGKIKCVYIDPPFNTAQTFANYEDNLQHSVWLTMMRDRLEHLHALLSDDGSIWVHLDDVENHRMRVLMDEVFGLENFAAEVVWQKADSARNDVSGFSADHDVILVYGKSPATTLNRMERTAADNARFSNPDGDERGIWFSGDRTAPAALKARQHPSVYGIQHPISGEIVYPAKGRCWAVGAGRQLISLNQFGEYMAVKPDLERRSAESDIPTEKLRSDVPDYVLVEQDPEKRASFARERIGQGNWPEFFVTEKSFGFKAYPPKEGQPPRTWWTNEEVGHNRAAKSELKALFPGQNPFSTPKPERLLERIIHIATNPGDIVLDVFAGSGTTAAVAHKMGRRWITCELIEDTMNRFTRPRLEKVVAGEDPGGITVTKGERIDATADGLPEGLTADEAQKLTSLLNKTIRGDDALKKSADVRAIKQMVKTTKSPDTINWRGGGGFTVAKLSPACFDYDEEYDTVTLTEAATGDVLVDSVCANMNYRRTPGHPNFDGVRGRMRLAVLEGTLTAELADELISKLDDGDLLTIAATGVTDGVSAHLRTAKRGCVVTHIPGDLFQTRRVERTN
ncbi:site-specific DNA-methyltransferase [Corynebacterium terpenotabidum]|uniref:Putative type III restriction-modification system n=1 Tax=Corynebacterium terpenotabidum Y-11 TaxID=1200352 RepID=S4XJP8_9CORY|nr:site-specific DNA-methyltransferase [Corynebacterium terpenotabidum]AGP31970.1 putative type III restriction-modification system [Corynebacterium terpenotabidum Y-11]